MAASIMATATTAAATGVALGPRRVQLQPGRQPHRPALCEERLRQPGQPQLQPGQLQRRSRRRDGTSLGRRPAHHKRPARAAGCRPTATGALGQSEPRIARVGEPRRSGDRRHPACRRLQRRRNRQGQSRQSVEPVRRAHVARQRPDAIQCAPALRRLCPPESRQHPGAGAVQPRGFTRAARAQCCRTPRSRASGRHVPSDAAGVSTARIPAACVSATTAGATATATRVSTAATGAAATCVSIAAAGAAAALITAAAGAAAALVSTAAACARAGATTASARQWKSRRRKTASLTHYHDTPRSGSRREDEAGRDSWDRVCLDLHD